MLRMTGPARAEVEIPDTPDGLDEAALAVALDEAYAAGAASVGWWVPVGDWAARRTAWRLGFSYGGVLRGWLPSGDAWAFTRRAGDPAEPVSRWLENPVIEGDGVRLRPFTPDDVQRVVEGIGDPETQHWLSFMPREPGEEQGREYLETATQKLADNHTITWAFAAIQDDRLLGAVGLYRLEVEPEIGYWTHPDARGRRLTTRAAALALGHAFETMGLPRVTGFAAAGNTGSLRVLESLGMTRIGVARHATTTGDGAPADLVGYDVLAEEFTSRRWSAADQSSTAMPATDSSAPTSAGAR